MYQFFKVDRLPRAYPGLRLKSDRLKLEIKSHEFIRHLGITVYVQHFLQGFTGTDVARKLNDLHSVLQSAFSLVENEMPLHVEVFIKSSSPYRITYGNLKIQDYDQRKYERVFLSLLEALKEPIYDLVHAGSKVNLKFRDSRHGFSADHLRLFHLTPAQWKKVRPAASWSDA
jgi:hypothetical protein